MDRTNLVEQRRLMGLGPRFDYNLTEAESAGKDGGEKVKDPVHPDSPESDQPLPVTPKADDQEPPGTTGVDASKHWDMYRGLEEQAMNLARANGEMAKKLSGVTEAELPREARRAMKEALRAVQAAGIAQKEAYKKITEFGSTMLS